MTFPACREDASHAEVSNKPNVIIILTDDQGYADVGCYGAEGFTTPHLDHMADEGVQFTSFCSAAPVCSPSRAALLTGCYPIRVGITDVLFPHGPSFAEGRTGIGLNPQEVTIAELLKPAGYATAAIGKWHLGDDQPFLPTRHGFDEYFGLPYSNNMGPEQDPEFPPLPLLQDEEVIEVDPDQSQLTTRYTEKACDFIERKRQRPFFLYLAHSMPHVPLAVSRKFEGHSERGLYGDVIMEIDWSVGRILDKLDELGIGDNTLVVFASDNGPWLLYGNHAGSAGPYREGKMTTFDGGQRVPCIMRWPARIAGKSTSKEVVTTMDLLPTIAAIAGAELPQWTIDGKNILPIIEGQPGAKSPHEAIYFYDGVELQAVRTGQWKLHFSHSYRTVIQPGVDGEPGLEELRDLELSLYDLEQDPSEATNLAAQHPELVSQLTTAATAFDADLKANQRPAGRL